MIEVGVGLQRLGFTCFRNFVFQSAVQAETQSLLRAPPAHITFGKASQDAKVVSVAALLPQDIPLYLLVVINSVCSSKDMMNFDIAS